MYQPILDDLKSRFGNKIFISPKELAELICKSAEVQANMRSSGTFPIPSRKIGSSVVYSLYDIAQYISEPTDAASSTKKKAATPSSSKAKPSGQSRVSPKWLLALQSNVQAATELLQETEDYLLKMPHDDAPENPPSPIRI